MFGLKKVFAEKRRCDGLNKNIRALNSFIEAVVVMRFNENNHELRDALQEAATALSKTECLYQEYLQKVIAVNGQ